MLASISNGRVCVCVCVRVRVCVGYISIYIYIYIYAAISLLCLSLCKHLLVEGKYVYIHKFMYASMLAIYVPRY